MDAKKVKKILMVCHFTQTPDEVGNERFVYIADMLVRSGYDLEVVTTSFSHKKKKQREVTKEQMARLSYQLTLLYEPGYPKNVCLKRFKSHRIFATNVRKYLGEIEKPDLVYCAIPSLKVAKVCAKYCKEKGVKFIVDIQDLWPEAFKLVLRLPIVSGILFAPMTRQANYAYKNADKIVAVSNTYKNRGLKVNKKDDKGLCVFLGTELADFDKKAKSLDVDKPQDEIWIAYAGTLGHSYNLELIFDALNLIADKITKKVVFKVYGDGPYLERFKNYAKTCKIEVDFLGRLEYSEMVANLVRADIAVNPITRGSAGSIINKHGDYAMAGLAVVNTQESKEYRALLEDYNFGINCGVESVNDVANALLELVENDEKRILMGKNSRKLAEEKFDRKTTYQEILKLIEEI